ncbi:MAG: fibronectin type III domain-containing protein [Lachnospiraceae bacterium]|nr:fibronectin type III domain-containing protein [Lachnospiraceae bacterium]
MEVQLGTKSVGSIVKLIQESKAVEYIVVHQGRPSSLYDASCNGTWLLRKYVEKYVQKWNSSGNKYANSDIHSYLNGEYYNSFYFDIRDSIIQAKIPYAAGNKSSTVYSGASGLSAKVFLLSGYEVGHTTADNSGFPVDGAKLDYFEYGTNSSAVQKRWGYSEDGAARSYSLRSPRTDDSINNFRVSTGYYISAWGESNQYDGVRPALILPSTLWVNDSGFVSTNIAPTMPSSITVPPTVKGGETFTISWGASTDENNNLQGYRLQRSIDNGSTWTEIYSGSSRSKNDRLTMGLTNVVRYRVQAYDANGATSNWRSSPAITVINNTAPIISGSDSDLGLKTEVFEIPYTVTDADSGQIITVSEIINGIQKREYEAASGQENIFKITESEWIEVLNGQHTLKIIASDNEGASASRTYTFSKNVTEIELMLSNPLPADDIVTKSIMNITRQIPAGATFTVEVCNNGNDTEPIWEDITNAVLNGSKFFFTNTEKTADDWGYNFRVKISRNNAIGDCFISSVGGNFE